VQLQIPIGGGNRRGNMLGVPNMSFSIWNKGGKLNSKVLTYGAR
jgi:hypothetical protein